MPKQFPEVDCERASRPAREGIFVYFVVGNDELCEAQRANGAEIVEEPGDRPYGLRRGLDPVKSAEGL